MLELRLAYRGQTAVTPEYLQKFSTNLSFSRINAKQEMFSGCQKEDLAACKIDLLHLCLLSSELFTTFM